MFGPHVVGASGSGLPAWLIPAWGALWCLWVGRNRWRYPHSDPEMLLTIAPLLVYTAALWCALMAGNPVSGPHAWDVPPAWSWHLALAHTLPAVCSAAWWSFKRWCAAPVGTQLLWICLQIHALIAVGYLRWLVWP